MFVECLIKETVELQGFRMVTVQNTGYGLEAQLAPTGVPRPTALPAGRLTSTVISAPPAASGMCRCGESTYT